LLVVTKEAAHSDNIEVLNKKITKVQGLPAIVATFRYEDPLSHRKWFDKDILIHGENGSPTYRIGLHCSQDDASVLSQLFDEMAESFRVLGPPA
jgi:hypothetical protein